MIKTENYYDRKTSLSPFWVHTKPWPQSKVEQSSWFGKWFCSHWISRVFVFKYTTHTHSLHCTDSTQAHTHSQTLSPLHWLNTDTYTTHTHSLHCTDSTQAHTRLTHALHCTDSTQTHTRLTHTLHCTDSTQAHTGLSQALSAFSMWRKGSSSGGVQVSQGLVHEWG